MIGFIHGLFVGSCLLAAAGTAMSPSTLAVDFSTDTSPPAQEVNLNHIDENEAKEIAIQNAGVSINDVAFTNVYHKYENGYDIIKVEFKKGVIQTINMKLMPLPERSCMST